MCRRYSIKAGRFKFELAQEMPVVLEDRATGIRIADQPEGWTILNTPGPVREHVWEHVDWAAQHVAGQFGGLHGE